MRFTSQQVVNSLSSHRRNGRQRSAFGPVETKATSMLKVGCGRRAVQSRGTRTRWVVSAVDGSKTDDARIANVLRGTHHQRFSVLGTVDGALPHSGQRSGVARRS